MKKWLIRFLLLVLFIVLTGAIAGYFWLKSAVPDYQGDLHLKGLHAPVRCTFDNHGIPRIEAGDMHDLYLAFGYIHASERLFQMEILRRAGKGTLSEIIGSPVLKIDVMMRTIGLPACADSSARLFEKLKGQPIYQDAEAYIQGINAFMTEGPTPEEFSILGIPKNEFTIHDMFAISGAMSFSFSMAQKTDFFVDHIYRNYGNSYLDDLGIVQDSSIRLPNVHSLPTSNNSSFNNHNIKEDLALTFAEIESILPFAPFSGSNSWVVGPNKTKDKKVIFCNDTHIGYTLPQTWYEADLRCPSFHLYGHFLAGVPFALVGRKDQLSWGLTMFLNDDMDFYEEKFADNDHVIYKGESTNVSRHRQTISIKGHTDTTIEVINTPHGPIVSGIFDGMDQLAPKAISMKWTYTLLPNQTVQAFYGLNHADNLQNFESYLPLIHAPGLNIEYGDDSGHYAWWACAALAERPENMNSLIVQNGSDGSAEWSGFMPFSSNPKQVDPPVGFVSSANEQQGLVNGKPYPGYYKPKARGNRIKELLSKENEWNIEKMKTLITDVVNEADAATLTETGEVIRKVHNENSLSLINYSFLFAWDGSYELKNPEPTFYHTLMQNILSLAMADELGQAYYSVFSTSHQFEFAKYALIKNNRSPWWDDVTTKDKKEKRSDIIMRAFERTVATLTEQYGRNPKVWNWRKACALEIRHPLGEVAVLRPIFNIGPDPVSGGTETILQSGFHYKSEGEFKAIYGSQMRIITDYAHPDSGLNITPAGQSGHLLSPYYADQSTMYRERKFRLQHFSSTTSDRHQVLNLLP